MPTAIYTVTQQYDGETTSWVHAYRTVDAAKAAIEADDAEQRATFEEWGDDVPPPGEWLQVENIALVLCVLGDHEWSRYSIHTVELQD